MNVAPPKKILLIRLSALGDIIQSLCVLPILKANCPNAEIGWVVNAELAPAIQGHPHIDRIHIFEKRWLKTLANPGRWNEVGQDLGKFFAEIKACDYDVVMDLQGLLKTALIAGFSGIKRRIGLAHGREFSGFFYTEKYVSHKEYFDHSQLHHEHFRILAEALAGNASNTKEKLKLTVQLPKPNSEIEEKVRLLLADVFVQPAPIVALAPGTQWSSKIWPVEYWQRLLKQIIAETEMNIIMVGAKSDVPLINDILNGLESKELDKRLKNLVGLTSIPEMYALYKHVQVAIGPDSAPLHIAGALGVPHVIGLYGATSQFRTPPIGSSEITLLACESTLPCQPCHKDTCRFGTNECMINIPPERIFQKIDSYASLTRS